MDVTTPPEKGIGGSLFMCSEQNNLCFHACTGHKHKIFWNNAELLKNEGEGEDDVLLDDADREEFLSSWRQRSLANVVEGLFTASDEAWEEALAQALISHGVDMNSLQRDSSQQQQEPEEQMEVGGAAAINPQAVDLIDQVAANISNAITTYFRAMGRADAERYFERLRQNGDSEDDSSDEETSFAEPPPVTRVTNMDSAPSTHQDDEENT